MEDKQWTPFEKEINQLADAIDGFIKTCNSELKYLPRKKKKEAKKVLNKFLNMNIISYPNWR